MTESIEKFSDNSTSEEDIITYYEANKTDVLEQKKDYYQKNKHKILEKIKCECGAFITKHQMKRHQRTKRHKTFLELLEAKPLCPKVDLD